MGLKFDWEKNKEKIHELELFIEENKNKKGALMPVLHKAQDIFGYLPLEVQNIISEGLSVPLSEVYGVATFYSKFSLIPKGEYTIGVCLYCLLCKRFSGNIGQGSRNFKYPSWRNHS